MANKTVITKDGKTYEIEGSLSELINRALNEYDKKTESQDVSTEDADSKVNKIYCVAIHRVEQKDVDEFASMISDSGKLVLFAINPGRAKRTSSMEALERLAEENDIDVCHNFDMLRYLSDFESFIYVGPIAEVVKKALTKDEQGSEDTSETDVDKEAADKD